MKIDKIEIKGLFDKKDIVWQLNPHVNVLVGENGSGKSTILGIICDLLKNNYMLGENKFLFNVAKIYFSKGYIETESNDDFFRHIQINSTIEQIKQGFVPYKSIYFKNIEFYEEIAPIHVDIIQTHITNSNAYHTIRRSNRTEENMLDMEIRETIHELNKLNNQELILKLLSCLNVFFNQIGKHVDFQNNELVYSDTKLNKNLNYSHLSSGERQLIYILLRVALSNQDKSKTAIILMDEPEISLHLDWQDHFIKQLTILNPDAQFIIVTHSPALIMNGWNDVYTDMEEITTWL